GKQVIDLSVVPSSQAEALTRLRARTGVESVVFIGDDTADEVALETLGDGDLGLKVGQESVPTHADFRLSSPAEVSVVLGALFEMRKRSEERRVGNVTIFQTCALPISRR